MDNNKLEERLIDFGVLIVEVSELSTASRAAVHLTSQLIRSGTSPALNNGEARSAESTKDFIHKLQVVLKELRESNNCMKILVRANLMTEKKMIERALAECNELISIFVSSINTTNKKKIADSSNSHF